MNLNCKALAPKMIALLAFVSTTIFANPPYYPDLVAQGNRWLITAYNDASPVHSQWATQGLCFFYTGTNGTHQQYAWVSDTFPDWNGRAVQEGDQVFMHGDYAKDVGHDGMTWQLTTVSPADVGFGHWEEWREDGRLGNTIGFANARLTRVGKCHYGSYEEALEKNQQLGLQENERGELIITPHGLTQREVDELLQKAQ